MTTIRVNVFRSGRPVDTVERPLRSIQGVPAITFRRRCWRVVDGCIDISSTPLDPDAEMVQEDPTGDEDDTPEREKAIQAPADARMLIEAGPGTGKTQLAAQRLAKLVINGLPPGQVLVLSFSRSAVLALTKRLATVAVVDAGLIEELRHVSIRTFDSWAFRVLRQLGEQPADLMRRTHDGNIALLTSLIQSERREEVLELLRAKRHLIVDEFQDLPGVRGDLVLALLELLAPPARPGMGFTVLGDCAQAIFGFANRATGAGGPSSAEYWRTLRDRYGADLSLLSLRMNHRATPDLAALSAKLRRVLLGPGPDSRKLQAARQVVAGLPVLDAPLSRDWVEAGTGVRAILTRTNGEALRIEQMLFGADVDGPSQWIRVRSPTQTDLPPAWVGGLLGPIRSETVARAQFSKVHAVLAASWGEAVCRQLSLPDDATAWSRLLRASGRSEGAALFRIQQLQERLMWPDAFPDDQSPGEGGVLITTIHQSKGLEFDEVIVLQGQPPHAETEEAEEEDGGDSTDDGEEAAVAYVAITRAAQSLTRLPAETTIYSPRPRRFRDERRRHCWWARSGWFNLEVGLRNDIDPLGFVDADLHGGADAVEAVQKRLLAGAQSLVGHKVMLRKARAGTDAIYKIHLQEGNAPGLLLGRTTQQLSLDLLDLLWKKGYGLPPRIMNLRIARVGTVSDSSAVPQDQPSCLWLGVSLHGLGGFRLARRKKE